MAEIFYMYVYSVLPLLSRIFTYHLRVLKEKKVTLLSWDLTSHIYILIMEKNQAIPQQCT